MEIQRAWGFLFVLKHNDEFHLSSHHFLFYSKSVHDCFSVFAFLKERKARSRAYQMSFTLEIKVSSFRMNPIVTSRRVDYDKEHLLLFQ